MTYLHEALTRNSFSSIVVCQPKSAIEKYCEEKNLPTFSVKMRSEADLCAALRIARFCKDNNISIVHAHSGHAVAIGELVKILCSRVKLVVSRRVQVSTNKNFISRLKYSNNLIEKIICVSDGVKNVLISDGINSDKLITIHSGIEIGKFSGFESAINIKERYNILPDEVLVGTVSAFSNEKDYPTFLRAAREVLRKRNYVKFLALGDGILLNEMKELAKHLDIEEHFIFAGFHSNVGEFLNSFDIYASSSVREGLGTSILDAQTCGLPVVAAKTGGIPEIIKHESNGFLFQPRNFNEMANYLDLLISNKALRARCGAKGKEDVKEFSIENTIRKNIALYNELIYEKKK